MSQCALCNKFIVGGTVVTALERSYHENCFRCRLCDSPLKGSFFGVSALNEDAPLPFCEGCVDEAENLASEGKLQDRITRPSAASTGTPVVARPTRREETPDPYKMYQEEPAAPVRREEEQEPHPPPSVAINNAFNRPSPPPEEFYRCHKCQRDIAEGTVVNALDTHFHESCFVCTSCSRNLDTFFGCEGLPYCESCIDAAEDAAGGGWQGEHDQVERDDAPAPAPEPVSVETKNQQMEEKLAMIKLALLDERKNAQTQYGELQLKLEREQEKNAALEGKLREVGEAAGDARDERARAARLEERVRQLEAELREYGANSGGDVERVMEQNRRLQQEVDSLKEQLDREKSLAERKVSRAQHSADQAAEEAEAARAELARVQSETRGSDELSEALASLQKSKAREREKDERIAKLERELREAQTAAASAPPPPPPSFADNGSGGAPPPPPPPPGAPPPPPMTQISHPLKINRTGQSQSLQEPTQEEHNPQNDLIAELKKGRPQLRRTPAQRPSKKDLLTRNANTRMASAGDSRPDPSVVKGADTGNSYARKMASNAEKTAVLANERDQRVKQGELKMKVHRNKFLDEFLDQNF